MGIPSVVKCACGIIVVPGPLSQSLRGCLKDVIMVIVWEHAEVVGGIVDRVNGECNEGELFGGADPGMAQQECMDVGEVLMWNVAPPA